jgi:hypothetical protein
MRNEIVTQTSKSLPRLSVVLEESSLHEAAPNVAAVLTTSLRTSSNAYVVVAAYPDRHGRAAGPGNHKTSHRGALGMADLLGPHSQPSLSNGITSGAAVVSTVGARSVPQKPVLQLNLYSLQLPSAVVQTRQPAALAPDMMQIHTVSLTCDDMRLALPPQQHHQTPATTEAGKSANASSTAAMPPEAVVVEQVAWVGRCFIALKTRQRQLLLVQSGLAEFDRNFSDDDDDASDTGAQSPAPSPVRKAFSRVADFCTVTVAISSHHSAEVSVLIVAGMQHVSAVVVMPEALQGKSKQLPISLREHTWNIGPFNHLSAAGVAAVGGTIPVEPSTTINGQTLYVCGTSANNSIEVFRWPLDSSAPPVCLHHVLTPPGHFFYGVSVTVHSSTKPSDAGVDFWVVGATSATIHDTDNSRRQRGGVAQGDADAANDVLSTSALPALRGPDGNYFQVEAPATATPAISPNSHSLSLPPTEHRVLNSVWQSIPARRRQSRDTPVALLATDSSPADTTTSTGATAAAVATLGHLESVASLLIGAPRFLPCGSRNMRKEGSTVTASASAMQRILFHIHGYSETCLEASCPAEASSTVAAPRRWGSEVLSLNTAECAAALEWLADADDDNDDGSGATVCSPLWRLTSTVALVQSEDTDDTSGRDEAHRILHELTWYTSHKILTLCVETLFSPSPALVGAAPAPRVHVRGTHKISSLSWVVGLCSVPHAGCPSPPILLLNGTGQSVKGEEGPSADQQLTLYGQPKNKKVRTIVVDIAATLLRRLEPWRRTHTRDGERAAMISSNTAQLLAAVQSMVEAEGKRLQRHLDARMDRLESLIGQLTQRRAQ